MINLYQIKNNEKALPLLFRVLLLYLKCFDIEVLPGTCK